MFEAVEDCWKGKFGTLERTTFGNEQMLEPESTIRHWIHNLLLNQPRDIELTPDTELTVFRQPDSNDSCSFADSKPRIE